MEVDPVWAGARQRLCWDGRKKGRDRPKRGGCGQAQRMLNVMMFTSLGQTSAYAVIGTLGGVIKSNPHLLALSLDQETFHDPVVGWSISWYVFEITPPFSEARMSLSGRGGRAIVANANIVSFRLVMVGVI